MSGLGRFPTYQLINFLRLCPGIEELELHSNSIFEEPVNYFEEPIVLSALWKLELDCDYGSGLLGLLRAPNLLSAVLLHAPHDLHVVGTFISDVRSLIHLSLVDLDFSSAILHDSVKTLMELERLRLVACKTPEDLWLFLTPDEEGVANCPKLDRLEISGTSLGVGFVELVRRRMSASQQGGDGNDEARCLLAVVIENCTIPHSDVTALEVLQLEREGLFISGLAGTLDRG